MIKQGLCFVRGRSIIGRSGRNQDGRTYQANVIDRRSSPGVTPRIGGKRISKIG